MVEQASVAGDGVLRVVPTPSWLRRQPRRSSDGGLAFYEMWKNGRPVTMVIEDASGADYIRIADGDQGRGSPSPRPGACPPGGTPLAGKRSTAH